MESNAKLFIVPAPAFSCSALRSVLECLALTFIPSELEMLSNALYHLQLSIVHRPSCMTFDSSQ